jgi:hypothetical protein
MKNKILISLLIVSFFNYLGCESIYVTHNTISQEEIDAGRPLPDESIRIILNSGRKIECAPPSDSNPDTLYYLRVDTPGTYIMGRGQIINLSNGETSKFNGSIQGDEIDSSSLVLNSPQGNYAVWPKANKNECILFKDGYFVEIKPEQGTGYFIWRPNTELRQISFNEIKEIQESYTNWYFGGFMIAIGVAAVVGFILFINEMNDFWR